MTPLSDEQVEAFIDAQVRRAVRRYTLTETEFEDLRGAGRLGAQQGEHDWRRLPEAERTEDRWRAFVATAIYDAVWHEFQELRGRRGKRASALHAATWVDFDNASGSFVDRLAEIKAVANHEWYASSLHGRMGLDSPEDQYIQREEQEDARARARFALARLEREEDRVLAHKLYIEKTTLTEACAAIGIHEKSARTRAHNRLKEQLREHAREFASARARRRTGDGGL